MRLSICYTLMQLPSTALVMLVLYFMMDAGWLSELSAALILCAWLLKDVVLYPFFRQAMRKGPPIGDAALVGRSERAGATSGWSRMPGARWHSRPRDGERLPCGTAGRVVAVEGPVLRAHGGHLDRGGRPYPEHSDPDSEPAA